jgi:chromosome segregation ATPase
MWELQHKSLHSIKMLRLVDLGTDMSALSAMTETMFLQTTLNLLQAVEQYEALRVKEAEQVAELDSAREEAKAAMAAFNDLSSRRYDLFMAAFDHVAAHIDPIFKVWLQAARRWRY